MPMPNFPGKHELPPYFQPADYFRLMSNESSSDMTPLPEGAVLVYNSRLMQRILDRYEPRKCQGLVGFHELQAPSGRVAVIGDFGIGGPAAAAVMEELIGAGVRRVISLDGAGGLQPAQSIGDLVVCDGAVRDEGVSYHYLPPEESYVHPDEALTARLLEAAKQRADRVVMGSTWTTDAPYRETREEVLHYRSEGVLTVEMEAASLAAVALHHGVAFAAAFAVMDSLVEEAWQPEGMGHQDAFTALDTLFDAATAALV